MQTDLKLNECIYDNTDVKILVKNNISYTPKVSIIIPVYNVETYLNKCMDSVINQTLKEIEIICVDDGSTDSSLKILKKYAKSDNRITLIAPKHIGTGRCRNIALRLVKGEYVGFVDPDDWIEDEYFEKLYSFTDGEPDIVFQTARREIYPDENREVVIDTPKSNNDIIFRFNIINYSGHLWSKLFKRSFIELHNFKNSFTKRAQDLLLTFPAILLAKEIRCINHAKYFYRKGHKSACTVEYTPQDAEELISLYSQIENKVSEFNENMLALVKYKKNQTLKKTYSTSSETVKNILRKNVKSLYEIDFDISSNEERLVTIKNPAPNSIDMLWWGDYWLGLDLAQGLKEKGMFVKIDYFDLDKPIPNSYVNIVIRGMNRNLPVDSHKLNIMYLISHPDDVSLKEVEQYNIVIVASKKKCKYFRDQGIKAYYLPQFTNPKRFYNEKDSAFKTHILFVGNAYNGIRPAVEYATKNHLPISIFGKYWSKYISDKKYIKGEYIDNNDLHKYYSNAEIVLNDTNDNMKREGFVSNRIHDVTACKAFVISDYLPEIEEMYGDAIPMYRNEKEFCQIVEYYLNHPEERRQKAEQAYKITLKYYTNIIFSKNLKKIISEYVFLKRPLSILSDYILLPYNLYRFKNLKKLISPKIIEQLTQASYEKEEERARKEKQDALNKIRRLLIPVRIDVKNQGEQGNNLVVTAEGKISTPDYFAKDGSPGYVIEYNKLVNKIKLKVIRNGELIINFKSQDKRYQGEKYPFWIDYKSIKINGTDILQSPVSVWHDKPYRYRMSVINTQELTIEIENNYYAYSAELLLDILEKFGKEELQKIDLLQFQYICEMCKKSKQ